MAVARSILNWLSIIGYAGLITVLAAVAVHAALTGTQPPVTSSVMGSTAEVWKWLRSRSKIPDLTIAKSDVRVRTSAPARRPTRHVRRRAVS